MIDDTAWYRAATLSERALAGAAPAISTADGDDEALARYRWDKWTAQSPFEDEAYLDQRLAVDHLDLERFRQLVFESPASLRARFPAPPQWLADIQRSLAAEPGDETLVAIRDWRTRVPETGFLQAAAPFLETAVSNLRRGVDALANGSAQLPIDPATAPRLWRHGLANALLEIMTRVMVLELNVARLEGRLHGDSPSERFDAFLRSLWDHERTSELFREYPVLARLLTQRSAQWVAYCLELFGRLTLDMPELERAMGWGHGVGRLAALEAGVADVRSGGRATAILTFESGARIVYKPTAVGADAHFQELLTWFNTRGFSPAFRSLTVVDRGDYGWVEFVDAAPCQSAAEVTRFYQRHGAYLAILHVLRGTDLHDDNIIAVGEHPILVDLEALFQPRAGSPDEATSADDLAQQAIDDSVIEVGLLPGRTWGNARFAGMDISGLNTMEVQVTPHAVPQWKEAGTDAMHLVRERRVVRARKNRPTLQGDSIDVSRHHSDVVDGFTAAYAFLEAHAGGLLESHGPLRRFADDEVRVFVRSVRSYRRLLAEGLHPDMLRDALDRDRLFDSLWAEVEDHPAMSDVVPTECAALVAGWIPTFSSRPGSTDLCLPNGTRLPDYFTESGFAIAERRLRALGPDDRERQVWFIDASFATLASSAVRPSAPEARPHAPEPFDADRITRAAAAVGDRLHALAIREGGEASWCGITLVDGRTLDVTVAGLDLANGLPGLALFLAHLGAATGDHRHTELARQTVATVRARLSAPSSMTWVGAFDGWGGLIYVFSQLGTLWGDRALTDQACAWADALGPMVANDRCLDVYAGSAGCIGVLHALDRVVPSKQWVRIAHQCGAHLLARAEQTDGGLSWSGQLSDMTPHGGFIHGEAGIAWALARLAQWTGEDRFADAATRALNRARARTAKGPLEIGTPRPADAPEVAVVHPSGRRSAWCSGAPGIGLAMLEVLSLQAESSRGAVETWFVTPSGDARALGDAEDHSICHGVMGTIDVLLESAVRQPSGPWLARAQQAAMLAVDSASGSWRSGAPGGVETPGLLMGLAGIGYELLRIASPGRVPSVLTLDSLDRGARS